MDVRMTTTKTVLIERFRIDNLCVLVVVNLLMLVVLPRIIWLFCLYYLAFLPSWMIIVFFIMLAS